MDIPCIVTPDGQSQVLSWHTDKSRNGAYVSPRGGEAAGGTGRLWGLGCVRGSGQGAWQGRSPGESVRRGLGKDRAPGGPARAACEREVWLRCRRWGGEWGGGAGSTADLNGSLELEQHGLAHEDLSCFVAQRLDLRLSKVNLLAWSAPPHLKEPLDDGVHIEIAHRARPLFNPTHALLRFHALSSTLQPSTFQRTSPQISTCVLLSDAERPGPHRPCRPSTPFERLFQNTTF